MLSKHAHQTKPTSKNDKKQQILTFLRSKKIGVLATVDPNGEPHAAVMFFYTDGHFITRFTTKKGTKKSDNLAHNNHAMLIVYDVKSQTTAQITGIVSEIEDMEEAEATFINTIEASRETSGVRMPPISKLLEGAYVAYRLTPTQIRMAVYSRPELGSYSRLFETLDKHELAF